MGSGSVGRRRNIVQLATRLGARYGVVLFLVLLALTFSIINPDIFPTERNIQNVFGSNSLLLLAALGSMVPLVVGEFDLSVGFMIGLATVLTAALPGEFGVALLPAFFITLGIGVLVGLVNGVLITKMGISSFIATLGSGTVISGISLYVSGGRLLFSGIPQGLKDFAQGFWLQIPILTILAVLF